MKLEEEIITQIEQSIELKRFLQKESKTLINIAELLVSAFQKGKKVLIFGNGGSAADAQHIATELVSRFYHERRSLPAIALTTDTSALTAIANDYGYENVFHVKWQD